jgi:hypothetical protein
MTPAPPELHDAGRRLSYAYHDLYDHFDGDGWAEAWDGYRVAIRRFEAAVRAVAGSGSSAWPGTGGKSILRYLRFRGGEAAEARAEDHPSAERPHGWRRGGRSAPRDADPEEPG